MSVAHLTTRIQTLLHRPDFKKRPVRALARRLWWRVRWSCTDHPWQLKLDNGHEFLAPRTGAAALLYYLGTSEPATAQVVTKILRPGMTFIDVGAHIGEYTVMASRLVGPQGQVHSFEPDPRALPFLRHNVFVNRATNVRINSSALADRCGEMTFVACTDPCLSFLGCPTGIAPRTGNPSQCTTITVDTDTLETYCRYHGLTPNLIKIDVEGAELLVLKGARALLQLPPSLAPLWIIEYSPETYGRYGFEWERVHHLLRDFGFSSFIITDLGDTESVSPSTPPPRYVKNLLARKIETQHANLHGKLSNLWDEGMPDVFRIPKN